MEEKVVGKLTSLKKTDTCYVLQYESGESAELYILNNHVFKYYMSPTGVFLDYPTPNHKEDVAKINVKKITDYDKRAYDNSYIAEDELYYTVHTKKIQIVFHRFKGTFTIHDKRTKREVLKELSLSYTDTKSMQTLYQNKDEYFFGGGMQNGRFTHKGEVINIVNSNNWVDGGVTSPCPFYWSTYGYGVLRNTWKPGVYDFGSKTTDEIKTTHNGGDFDAFYFINDQPKYILADLFELTGKPLLMPEYAFYQAHLNTFNRDYWVKVDSETPNARLFEDGFYYKKYAPQDMSGKKGVLESLNGEKDNYQFSARAMIDRYNMHEMPIGWFIPNDGYGSGYGQSDSLKGDIENLKKFQEYAKKNGVHVALWTESNLEPKDPEHPKKGERDLYKEVGDAGAVALKCDVAWIGSGYSYGLSAVEKATKLFKNGTKDNTRPMVIMVDGWAGTQRYSGIWSGDQTGGKWEYIRFHIPTYIGTGLSGQPVIGSDMDGIYGGGNKEVNVRDYQWKAFTPLQLNMDGWGTQPKTPFSFDDEATVINKAYLKLKSMLMPYNYSIGYESTQGLPMVRAMFIEFPDESSAYTIDSQYQFMWGPSILVAPIYKNEENLIGNSIRNGLYLPDMNQVWIDFLTGNKYQGGKIYNSIETPLWKIPVFVKDGALIPLVNINKNPNEIKRDMRIFNIYPNGKKYFEVYEDDGISAEYLKGHFAKTKITVTGPESNEQGKLNIHIHKTEGTYRNIVKAKRTLIRVMASEDIESIKVAINEKSIEIHKVKTEKEFDKNDNVCYFKEDYVINPDLEVLGGRELKQKFLLIKIQKTDVTEHEIQIKVKKFINEGVIFGSNNELNPSLKAPSSLTAFEENITPTSITLQWNPRQEAYYYEIERDGVIFTNIKGRKQIFDGFKYQSDHTFKIRSVNNKGVSKWSYTIIVTTKEDPKKNAVKGIQVSCDLPCNPCQEVCNLFDGNMDSLWHTDWGWYGKVDFTKGQYITLSFDLGKVYEIDKIEYTPREDAGNGTILEIQYKYCDDGDNWSQLSDPIKWACDETTKIIEMNDVTFRFIEFHILNTVGGFGSGKHMQFYAKNNN